MNYDTYLDHERYGLEEREEDVRDEVYVLHDCEKEVYRNYSYDKIRRYYNDNADKEGLNLGLIIEEDIDPNNWKYTMDLMTNINIC